MAVTDYLRGTGTQADPYVIHSPAGFKQFFEADRASGNYFEIVCDIDMGGQTIGGINSFCSYLNANGHKVFNVNISSFGWFSSLDQSLGDKYVKNLWLVATYTGSSNYTPIYASSTYRSRIINSRLDISCGSKAMIMGSSAITDCYNTIFNYAGTGNVFISSGGENSKSTYFIAPNISQINHSGVTRLSSGDCFLPSYYPTLGTDSWVVDAVSIPRTIPNGRPELTQAYAIKGKTSIGGVGRSRNISVVTSAYFGLLKTAKSDSNGNYMITMGDIYDPVVITHYDNYGFPFVASRQYQLGDVIHPPIPNGYAYDCTTAGMAAATSPTSWPTSGPLTTGAAIFTPRPIYKPESNLVQPVKVDLLTGLPV